MTKKPSQVRSAALAVVPTCQRPASRAEALTRAYRFLLAEEIEADRVRGQILAQRERQRRAGFQVVQGGVA